jgi:hypothetical protein
MGRVERFRVVAAVMDDGDVLPCLELDDGHETLRLLLGADDAARLASDLAGLLVELDRRRVEAWATLN